MDNATYFWSADGRTWHAVSKEAAELLRLGGFHVKVVAAPKSRGSRYVLPLDRAGRPLKGHSGETVRDVEGRFWRRWRLN